MFLVMAGCVTRKNVSTNQSAIGKYEITLDTFNLYDRSRNRKIPVAIFRPGQYTGKIPQQVVVFSHGYGQNKPGSYLAYAYLTDFLASKGFFVASVQHELTTDSLLPHAGTPRIVRRSFWDRGADNILFVINELQKTYPQLDFHHITLIGHSNGADMTALFPLKYPDIVSRIITLDNRRMALPENKQLKVCSLHSSDQPADDGVVPTAEEQTKFGITIINLSDTKHNDMDDTGTEKQHKEINGYVLKFLTEK